MDCLEDIQSMDGINLVEKETPVYQLDVVNPNNKSNVEPHQLARYVPEPLSNQDQPKLHEEVRILY